MEPFRYRIPDRAQGIVPGAHPGTQRGPGMEFRGHTPLPSAPDPRRFDVAASLRDPFNRVMVRVYTQRGAVPVRVLADVSASLGFAGRSRKMDLLADFTESLALATHRTGDPLTFIGCDGGVRTDLRFGPTRSKAAGPLLAEKLREFVPSGRSADGLHLAARELPPTRSLLFVVSDFHFPLDRLAELLAALARHTVVPVVLWDSAEATPPRYGIARLRDPETGQRRMLLLRPALARRLEQSITARARALRACCARFGVTPLFVVDRFDAEAVTRYFYG